ncbi:Aste57867_17269 [Aphanomyces stellatus]|uniref:ER membrane protein complex subunit 4 n=1 Tax=Aphanomyces stellatus TaxID=120398 RepID=A0A485L925_9STRA|nr:hypothetical protein As57867_017210 [Aphanomyces stellatus]VFT94025.1 Aste57867_17269 [Aphanomyces stellatus]
MPTPRLRTRWDSTSTSPTYVFCLQFHPGLTRWHVQQSSAVTTATSADTLDLKKKRASEIAQAPFKGLFQTAFMMWMSGSSVNIFSIMITAMAIFNPLKALFDVNAAFVSVNDGKIDLTQMKITFIAANLVAIAAAVYKCGTMGLLPTTSADWTWLLPIKHAIESSASATPIY